MTARSTRNVSGPLARVRECGLEFVVVGGSGWIGRASLDLLHRALGPDGFARRVHVLGSASRTIAVRPGLSVPCRALSGWRELAVGPACLIHNGFLTRDKVAGMDLVDYVARNRAISSAVVSLGRSLDIRAVVLPSSGAVYAIDGSLDRDLDANPYGVLKVEDEATFVALAGDKGAALAMPRIFGLSGEFINKPELFALAAILDAIRLREPVRLRARHPVFRSYVDIGDLLMLCLCIALGPTPTVEIFDTAGETQIEIGDLARLAARTLGWPDHPVARDYDPALPPDRYLGDPRRIRDLFAEYGLVPLPLPEQIRRTAAYLEKAAASGR